MQRPNPHQNLINNARYGRNLICVPAGMSIDRHLPENLRYASKESLETCPYDSNHRVKPTRLRGHIIKCARNHPPLAICYFNATHRMPEELLSEHIKVCPSRVDVAPFSELPSDQLKIADTAAANKVKCQVDSQVNLNDDDDWD